MAQALVGLALVAILASACATASTPAASPEPLAIYGIDWQAVSVAGHLPPAANRPTIRFEKGRVEGNMGCNGFSTSNVRIAGNRLEVSEITQTLMLCSGEAGLMEELYRRALDAATSIGLHDGQLVISGPGGEIVFEAPGPAATSE
jgi:heat shock protein HslJ